jgi:invasion protein IalB
MMTAGVSMPLTGPETKIIEDPPIEPAVEKPAIEADGRYVLQPAKGLSVYRIPPDGSRGVPAVPVTRSVTNYGKWAVACESRVDTKTCFAAAYVQANRATVKIHVGPAADAATNGTIAGRILRGSDGHPRYVVTVEVPAGMDRNPGLTLSGSNAFAVLPLSDGCDDKKCEASAFIVPSEGTIARRDDKGEKSISVAGTFGDTGYVWRFSGDGLAAAFDRVRAEMGETQATPVTPVSTSPPEKQHNHPGAG